MGNSCDCFRRQNNDEAEDALLASLAGESRPRGPPPPYQPQAPVYNYALASMSEEQRAQLVRRITIIQSLPCIHYELRGDKDKKKEPRECAICMMDYSAGEPIRLLPCMHYYHLRCIDDWLMRSLTCPTCMERVDAGLITTLRTSRNGGNLRGGGTDGRSRGFSLRRRRRGRGQSRGSESENPLVSGSTSSRSSSRSSSTSSSSELLSPGGPISWQGAPLNPQQRQNLSQSSGMIFLPPFPSQNTNPPTSQNLTDVGPSPRVVSPPSSPAVVLIHSSPPHSPILPSITIHTPSPAPFTTDQVPAN